MSAYPNRVAEAHVVASVHLGLPLPIHGSQVVLEGCEGCIDAGRVFSGPVNVEPIHKTEEFVVVARIIFAQVKFRSVDLVLRVQDVFCFAILNDLYNVPVRRGSSDMGAGTTTIRTGLWPSSSLGGVPLRMLERSSSRTSWFSSSCMTCLPLLAGGMLLEPM